MHNQSYKPTVAAAYSPQTWTGWNRPELALIAEMDIHQPWKSVYGFPMTAAKLAAGQEMIFHAREEGVFEHLQRLNDLLASPQCLNRAYGLLAQLEQVPGGQRLDDRNQRVLPVGRQKVFTPRQQGLVIFRILHLPLPNSPQGLFIGRGYCSGQTEYRAHQDHNQRYATVERCPAFQRPLSARAFLRTASSFSR